MKAEFDEYYWEKLKHQYAGMVMQGLVTRDLTIEELTDISVEIAQALVQKLKEDKQ